MKKYIFLLILLFALSLNLQATQIGTKQIKDKAITTAKLDDSAVDDTKLEAVLKAKIPTTDEKAAMTNASSPDAGNPFATTADIGDKLDTADSVLFIWKDGSQDFTADQSMGGFKITGAGEAADDSDYVTLWGLTQELEGKVNVDGDTMTGDLVMDTGTDIKLVDMQLGTPTYSALHDYISTTQSAGVVSGGEITDNDPADSTVDVAAGTGMIRASDSATANLLFFDWDATENVALTNNSLNYILMNYHATTPYVSVVTSLASYNKNTQIPIGVVYRRDDVVEIDGNDGCNLPNFAQNEWHRLQHRGIEKMSGSAVTESGTRYLTVTAGVYYFGVTEILTDEVDTDTDTFTPVYRDGGTSWTYDTPIQQFSNILYDDDSGTPANVGVSKYATYYVYQCLEGDIYIQYGQGAANTLTIAQNEAIPTPPPYLTAWASLRAKIIILRGATNATSISNYKKESFTAYSAAVHNELSGLQGGTADQYYHMTAAQHGEIGNWQAATDKVNADSGKWDAAYEDSHIQGTDQKLDDGGGNEVSAAELRLHVDNLTKHREIDDNATGNTDLWSADKINTELSEKLDKADSAVISDIAYDDTTWNANTDGASKNAIRDKINPMDTAIGLNTAKETNVSTNITVVEAPTNVDIQSSDGSNDTIAAADVTNAGVMTKAMYDEHVLNNAKNTNVSTDLSEGTSTNTTVDVNSSDGNNATLVAASTSRAGVLTKAKFDEIVANTAKANALTRYLWWSPAYNGYALSADGGSNDAGDSGIIVGFAGTLGDSDTTDTPYMEWASTDTGVNDYDVIIRIPIPADYSSMGTFRVEYDSDTVLEDTATVSLYDSNDAADSSVVLSSSTWAVDETMAPSGTYTAGEHMTIKLHLECAQNQKMRVGDIRCSYTGTR